MKRLSNLAAGLLIWRRRRGTSGRRPARMAGSRCSTLSKMGDWSEVGKANWAMKDGALTVDKLDGKDLS